MESSEARPIIAAAEAAAAIDDYASAERLLREAAAVQERTLGPSHPDLANTFNNLGVVCERAGKIDEAEACYQRAYTIATTAFPPDHPFVATSRQNLEEFCAANGRSIDSPASAINEFDEEVDDAGSKDATYNAARAYSEDAPDAEPATNAASSQAVEPTAKASTANAVAPMRLQLDMATPAEADRTKPASSVLDVGSQPTAVGRGGTDARPADAGPKKQGPASAASTPAAQPIRTAPPPLIAQRVPERPSRSLPLAVLAVLGISFVIVLVGLIAWPSRPSEDAPPSAEPSAAAPAATETPAAVAPAERPTAKPPATTIAPPAVAPRRDTSTKSTGGLTVTDARLCRTLSARGEWECAPLGDPATPGTTFFYTRIVSARPTKVEHRWYSGDRLEQSVTLDIQPNSAGYRTFSRRTTNARRAGPWRVELRSEDGELLREERFTVSR